MDKTAARVARRVLAKGIALGNTYQNPRIRIHRYRDQIRVTDLTDAGKRGKKVRELIIGLTYSYDGDEQAWMDTQTHEFLVYARSSDPYMKIKSYIKDLMVDYPDDITLTEDTLRGIDVEPYGEIFEFKIPLDKGSVTVKSSPTDFSVKHTAEMSGPRGNTFNHDTRYHPYTKRDAVAFYGWVKDNASKLKALKNINDLRDIWKKNDIKYDYR